MWNIFVRELSGHYSPQNLDKNRLSRLVTAIDKNYLQRHFETTSGGGRLKQMPPISNGFSQYLNTVAQINRDSWNNPFSIDFSTQLQIYSTIYWSGRIIDGPLAIIYVTFPGIFVPIDIYPNSIQNAYQFASNTAVSLFLQKMSLIGIRVDKTTGITTPWWGGFFTTLDIPIGIPSIQIPMADAYENMVENMYNLYMIQDRGYANSLIALYKQIVQQAFPEALINYGHSTTPGYGPSFVGAEGGAFGGTLESVRSKLLDIYNNSIIGGRGAKEDVYPPSGGGGGGGGGSSAGGGGGAVTGSLAGIDGKITKDTPFKLYSSASLHPCDIIELSGSLLYSPLPVLRPYVGLDTRSDKQSVYLFSQTMSLEIGIGASTSSLYQDYINMPDTVPGLSFLDRKRERERRKKEKVIGDTFEVIYTVKSRLLKAKTYELANRVTAYVDVVADRLIGRKKIRHRKEDLNARAYIPIQTRFKFRTETYKLGLYTTRIHQSGSGAFRARFNTSEYLLNHYEPDYSRYPINRKPYKDAITVPWITNVPARPCDLGLAEILVRPSDVTLYVDYFLIEKDEDPLVFPGGIPYRGSLYDSTLRANSLGGLFTKTIMPYVEPEGFGTLQDRAVYPIDEMLSDDYGVFRLHLTDEQGSHTDLEIKKRLLPER